MKECCRSSAIYAGLCEAVMLTCYSVIFIIYRQSWLAEWKCSYNLFELSISLTCLLWTYVWHGGGLITAATLSGNSLRQTFHTHRASVHQAAKLVAALLREGNCMPGGK